MYPASTEEKDKLIWGKKYDLYLKKEERYDDQKAKVFTVVTGQCEKSVKNQVQVAKGYATAETGSDVIGLLRMIKNIAFDTNDRKYPVMQAAMAWKNLAKVWQQETEDLVDYYKRFMSLVEMVELSYGEWWLR